MKNKSLAMVVIFSLLTCAGPLTSKERRGSELKIQKKDWTIQKGELIAVKKDSLLLVDSSTGADVTVNISDIISIEEKKKAPVLLGLGSGLAIGLAVGLAQTDFSGSGVCPDFSAYGFAFAGAAIGTIAGLLLGISNPMVITITPQTEVDAYLKKLSKKARVADFQ